MRFTFHNVSINTLLPSVPDHLRVIFTFHNVSINTCRFLRKKGDCRRFTFHNVSINTIGKYGHKKPVKNLHSTMFLLIRETWLNYKLLAGKFTFHNVSINTGSGSTKVTGIKLFTFHNVSINTGIWVKPATDPPAFTFHNVSINTTTRRELRVLRKLIYIPQCFY